MGILSKLPGYPCGEATGIMRLTGASAAASPLRYGVLVIGLGVYEQSMRVLNVCFLNSLARKIVGAGRAARLSVLRVCDGILSARNIYSQLRASMVDHMLRSEGSSSRRRMEDITKMAFTFPEIATDGEKR